jgi:membrane-associated protease RseP (regulator of RpoE activity)
MPARSPLKQLAWDAGSIFRVLKGLLTPKEAKNTAKVLGGPQMIAEGIYRSVRRDFWDGVGFLRFLNVNLAVLNLLPIPVLDGGLIMFALVALVFRRRVPEKVVAVLSTGFMYLLLAAMAILIFRDAQRSWRIHTYKPGEKETVMERQMPADDNETDNASN